MYDLGGMSKGSRNQLERVSTVYVRDNFENQNENDNDDSMNKIRIVRSVLKHTMKYMNEWMNEWWKNSESLYSRILK